MPCGSDYSFDIDLWPGTYDVRVQSLRDVIGPGANFALPRPDEDYWRGRDQRYNVAADVDVTSVSDLTLALEHVTVSTDILFEGATPVDGGKCDDPDNDATIVSFINQDPGPSRTLNHYLPCGSDYSFDIDLWPGTYDVRIQPLTHHSLGAGTNFALQHTDGEYWPDRDQRIFAERDFDVSSDTSLTLDLEHISVGGYVTIDGMTPSNGPACDDDPDRESVVVSFVNLDPGPSRTYVHDIPCGSDDYLFDVDLWPGTYQLRSSPIFYGQTPAADPAPHSGELEYVADAIRLE